MTVVKRLWVKFKDLRHLFHGTIHEGIDDVLDCYSYLDKILTASSLFLSTPPFLSKIVHLASTPHPHPMSKLISSQYIHPPPRTPATGAIGANPRMNWTSSFGVCCVKYLNNTPSPITTSKIPKTGTRALSFPFIFEEMLESRGIFVYQFLPFLGKRR